MSQGILSRTLAVKVLEDILIRRQPFEKSFSDRVELSSIQGRDKAFAYRLASIVLRRLGQIDDLIDNCLDSRLSDKAWKVKTVLRVGIAELLFLNTPPHAAIYIGVELANDRGLGPYKKLVNAILRRIDREGLDLKSCQDEEKINTPGWLWSSWSANYGKENCRRIAAAHLTEPPLDITARGDTHKWAARLSGKVLPTGSIRLDKGGVVNTLP
ncbi:MAG: transcription antitermination factor NusB, partial [Pseudomonadota bacterium]|nr:transcription antitermination factor NusB [Pseudomonadota bacterium]